MILLRGHHGLRPIENKTIASIGNFDGVHIGHQEIIRYVVQQGKALNLQPALVSFEPTAKEFFLSDKAPARIYSFRDKFEVIQPLGIKHFISLRFTRSLANMPAETFVKEILLAKLNIQHLIVGDDFRFGHNRRGDIDLLRTMAAQLDFKVEDQASILHDNVRVSSSSIRDQLAEGNFTQAATLLGRPFMITGRVFHGDKNGRSIGFPTANILLRRRISPLCGVFVITASTSEQSWSGVANVGSRPTVSGTREQLEVHLFNCDQDLYGQRLSVTFLHRLRDEQKFSSLDALKTQISLDVQQAQTLLRAKPLTIRGPRLQAHPQSAQDQFSHEGKFGSAGTANARTLAAIKYIPTDSPGLRWA